MQYAKSNRTQKQYVVLSNELASNEYFSAAHRATHPLTDQLSVLWLNYAMQGEAVHKYASRIRIDFLMCAYGINGVRCRFALKVGVASPSGRCRFIQLCRLMFAFAQLGHYGHSVHIDFKSINCANGNRSESKQTTKLGVNLILCELSLDRLRLFAIIAILAQWNRILSVFCINFSVTKQPYALLIALSCAQNSIFSDNVNF